MFAAAIAPASVRSRSPGNVAVIAGAVLIAAAVAQQCLAGLDCDVSWLLTVSERVLGGATLYVDVVEVNPPASVLLYLPGVALSHLLHLRPEPVIAASTFAAVLATLRSMDRLLAPSSAARPWLLGAGFWILAILPADCFAQREHWALLAVLPLLCVSIARGEERTVPDGQALLAGLGGGVAMAIKPHFALVLAAVFGWRWWRCGRAGPIGPEWFAAGLVALGYAFLVLLAFPHYASDMVPLLRAVYLPVGDSWTNLLIGPVVSMPAVLAVLTVYAGGAGFWRTPAAALLLAAAGFAAAALVQGRGYLNHAYPGAALAYLALALVLAAEGGRRRVLVGAWAVLAAIGWHAYAGVRSPERLAEAVARVAPAHPSLIVAGDDFMLGHPLTRWVDGRWMGRTGSLWAGASAVGLLARGEGNAGRLRKVVADDVAGFAADVARGRPDVVLVQRSALGWLRDYPAYRRAISSYRPAAEVDGTELWVRRTGS